MHRSIIDYAMDDNGAEFRKELYAAIYDKVADHIKAKKQEVAENLLGLNQESDEDEFQEIDEDELEDDYSDELEDEESEEEELDEAKDNTELHAKIVKAWHDASSSGRLIGGCSFRERDAAIRAKVPEATKHHINKAIDNHVYGNMKETG